ncbi:hypothetical protein EVAR_78076_1 [Eumeta japonica]|uniref:Uncharacterized protein n=1 Tax=Eumeta variegata TaxID=151549 RepID=A0A4C1T0B3_EUMVA|nr:hypothetical protein EVAR_78076_1 [Eumeta japonica]
MRWLSCGVSALELDAARCTLHLFMIVDQEGAISVFHEATPFLIFDLHRACSHATLKSPRSEPILSGRMCVRVTQSSVLGSQQLESVRKQLPAVNGGRNHLPS